MKKLILHALHQQDGADFFPFHDWLLPKTYREVSQELGQTRSSIGLYDLSYRGMVFLTGKDVTDLLQRISTNDLTQLAAAGTLPTLFCDARGRFIDQVQLFHFDEGELAVSCHPQAETLFNWLERFIIMEEVEAQKSENNFVYLSLCGPKALQAVRAFSGESIEEEDYLVLNQAAPFVAIVRNKFSKWPTYEMLFCGDGKLLAVERLVSIVKDFGGGWIGHQAAEILRIEAGIPASGSEINDQYNPHEARLLHAVSFTKGCYTGQEVIARLDTYDKVQKYLMVAELQASITEPLPVNVYFEEQPIGILTSYAFDPHGQKHWGLAYIKKNYAIEDFKLQVFCGDFKVAATLHLPPWLTDLNV